MTTSMKSVILLTLFLWSGNCLDDNSDDDIITYSGEMPSDSTLAKFEGLLSGLKNTDLLIMMDVSLEASQFVAKLSNISSHAVKCMKKFSDNGNSVAVMKFASAPLLTITFDDPCVKNDACLLKKTKDVSSVNEKRNLKKALRKARQVLSKRRETQASKKQVILLITFGVDQTNNSQALVGRNQKMLQNLGKKFLKDKVTIAVVGVGREAIKNKAAFQLMLNPNAPIPQPAAPGVPDKDAVAVGSTADGTTSTSLRDEDQDDYLLFSEETFMIEILEFNVKFACVSPFDFMSGGFGK